MVFFRRAQGPLNTAATLVVWGSLIFASEHAGFAMSGLREIGRLPGESPRLRYQFFMVGVFTIVCAVLLGSLSITQLRSGRKSGWVAVLATLAIDGGLELTGATGTL